MTSLGQKQVIVVNHVKAPKSLVESVLLAVHTTLDNEGHADERVEILLTDNDGIRQLNRELRELDEPTDVLSFPSSRFPGAPLGEIAISIQFVQSQATKRGISLTSELTLVTIHGVLHLLGLDDESDEELSLMNARTREIALLLGLSISEDWHTIKDEAHK